VKELSKGAVPWDTALTITQDIDGSHITHSTSGTLRQGEEAHIGRVVVVGYCAWVVDAERIEGGGERHWVGTGKWR